MKELLSPENKRFLLRWLGFSFVLHFLAGVFTIGYYDFDEHFQILEFMHTRIFGTHAQDLPWEFHSQIRPWLQPFFYEGIARVLMLIGVRDPSTWATVFRCVSALLGWMSLVGLALCCFHWFKKEVWQRNAVRFLCLFWYLPFLHARTSSENFAGLSFWTAFSLLTLHFAGAFKRGRFWIDKAPGVLGLAGFLFGISFHFRYQMVIAIAGTLVWIFFEWRKKTKSILAPQMLWLSLGFAGGIALGLGVDCWGYGNPVFAPYQYFYHNIILKRASGFGVDPFWYYVRDLAEFMTPMGLITLLGVLASLIVFPTHALSFVVIPFVFVHSWIAHKEQRFLYPLWPVFPILMVMAFAEFEKRMKRNFRPLGVLVLILNGMFAFYLSLKPITARPNLYSVIYRHQPPIETLYYKGDNPFKYSEGLMFHFYKDDRLKLVKVRSEADLPPDSTPFWFFYESFELPADEIFHRSCVLDYTVFPSWLKYLTIFPGPSKFASRWSLFRCVSF